MNLLRFTKRGKDGFYSWRKQDGDVYRYFDGCYPRLAVNRVCIGQHGFGAKAPLQQTVVFSECFLDSVAKCFAACNFNPKFRHARSPGEATSESREHDEEMTQYKALFGNF